MNMVRRFARSHRAFITKVVILLIVAFTVLLPVVPAGAAPLPEGPSPQPDPPAIGPFAGPVVSPVELNVDLRQLPAAPKHPFAPHSAPQGAAPDNAVQSPSAPNGSSGPIQLSQPPTAMPAPATTFEGLAIGDTVAGYVPPDPNGDVGPTYYIQAVNTTIGIYNKNTGARLVVTQLDTMFASVGGCSTAVSNYSTDPGALYDPLSGRWFISIVAANDSVSAGGPTYACIAVSKTSDPVSGGWYLYAIQVDAMNFFDNPQLGIWPDGIYLTGNRFKDFEATFIGSRIWSFNRAQLIGGGAVQTVYFDVDSTKYFGLLPSNLRGTPPPAGSPNYLVAMDLFHTPATSLFVWKFHVDWKTIANSTFTGPATLTVAPYTHSRRYSVPQPSGGELLDNRADWLMHQAQYRNIGGVESLWISHTAVPSGLSGNYNGVTGLGWYELRNLSAPTPAVYQEGTYLPDTTYRWMGSLAVDNAGNMAIGYSASSASVFPSLRYAGRLVSDPLNLLGQGEATLFAGTGYQSNSYNRWGDYSGMSIDPVDDCTFWYTNEYYATSAAFSWHTRIGSFKYPACTPRSTGIIRGSIKILPPGTPVSGTLVTAEPGSYLAVSNASGAYQLPPLPVGTYTVSASVNGYGTQRYTITIGANETRIQDFNFAPPVAFMPFAVRNYGAGW